MLNYELISLRDVIVAHGRTSTRFGADEECDGLLSRSGLAVLQRASFDPVGFFVAAAAPAAR